MNPRGRSTVRGIAAAQALAGAVLTLRPAVVAHRLSSSGAVPPAWIVRALGLRLLVQSAAEMYRPSANVALVGAAVESCHAATMLPLLLTHTYRRPATASAGAAAVTGTVLFCATQLRPTRR